MVEVTEKLDKASAYLDEGIDIVIDTAEEKIKEGLTLVDSLGEAFKRNPRKMIIAFAVLAAMVVADFNGINLVDVLGSWFDLVPAHDAGGVVSNAEGGS